MLTTTKFTYNPRSQNSTREWGMPFHMAKVFPRASSGSASTSIDQITTTDVFQERKTYTVWMKSLVLHSNGITIFNSCGEIVYRIDNYNSKRNREVLLMDLRGNVLCTLLRRKRRVSEEWDGHKFESRGKLFTKQSREKPWFRVRKMGKRFIGKKGISYEVLVSIDEMFEESRYQIKGSIEKSEFKIFDQSAMVIAEVKRKKLDSGVTFGEDVLSLVIEPCCVDPSFVVALVAVVGLMCHKI